MATSTDDSPARDKDRPTSQAATAARSEWIGERYLVHGLLGRGGMSEVYRVSDTTGASDCALKLLSQSTTEPEHTAVLALFEREYQTLRELDHPRVIRVHDFGVTPRGAYYTMEMLDGGSLTDCAPLPWRTACSLIHDVCSSLSLLHVRRLVHRDVSPQNVRRTMEGRAKLIDFGAMATMGPSSQVIGTPTFTAPEVVHRLPLDARTDLFSLGATFYFVLTGRLAYPARSFSQLNDAWSRKPPPPSAFASDIPHQLDALVMSMLSLEAALRPRHASEVMLQLATLLGTSDDEVADVSRAYLSTPSLTGRNDLMQWFRRRIARAPLRGGSSLVIEGGIGMGRTRALEACVTLAQTQGCIVVRASGSALDARPFATAQRLTEQLAGQLPVTCLEVARASRIAELLFEPPAAMGTALPAPLRVCGFDAGIVDRGTMQEALSKLFFEVARSRVVLIAVDDLERVDEPTQAWLATLAVRARKHKILVVFSMLSAGGNQQPASRVIARRSSHYALAPLSHVESEALLMSAFGDVPHVAMVAARIYNIAQGSPSATMALARHLIANASVSYRGGTWVMPARLSIHDLPRSVDEALTTRANAMSPAARQLGELHAVCIFGALSSADQCLLMCQDDSQLLPARAELLALNALVEDGGRFAVANERWRSALLGGLDGAVGAQRHRALGTLGMQTQRRYQQVTLSLLRWLRRWHRCRTTPNPDRRTMQ